MRSVDQMLHFVSWVPSRSCDELSTDLLVVVRPCPITTLHDGMQCNDRVEMLSRFEDKAKGGKDFQQVRKVRHPVPSIQ